MYAGIMSLTMLIGGFIVIKNCTSSLMLEIWQLITGIQSRRYKDLARSLKYYLGTEDALRVFVTEYRQVRNCLINSDWFLPNQRDDGLEKTAVLFLVHYCGWTVPNEITDPETYEFIQNRGCIVCDESQWYSSPNAPKRGNRLVLLGCGHIGHECCMKKYLLSKARCPRCKTEVNPFTILMDSSKTPGIIRLTDLDILV